MDVQTIRHNKWARRAAWAAGGVLALWAVAWVAVPPLVRSQAEKIASEQLGRKVTIGKVDFSPWSLELSVHDLAIATADGSAAQLAVKRLYIDAELQSLLRLAPVIDAVSVEQPAVRLTHLGGGRYDIDDILARLNKPSAQPAGEPQKFALYNLAISGGSLDFADKAVNKTHEVRDFALGIPFLSNLPSQREVKVEPHLALALNGSRFDSTAQGTPFTQTRKTDAQITLRQFDLKPYLGYLPAGLPVKLLGAVVSADVKLAFEQNPTTQVRLSGTVGVDKLAVADAAGGDLLAVQQIKVGLEDVRPLQQVVRLSKVEIQSPQVSAARGRDGRINLVPPAPPAAANAPEKIAGQQAPAGAAAQKASEKSPETPSKAKPWEVAVAQVLVHAGGATWSDDAVAPKARLALSQLELDAKGIALPFAQPLQFTGSATLEKTTLTFGGQATDQAATATLSLNQLPLALAAPYLAQFVEPAVAGQLGADVGVRWSSAGVLVVSAPRVELGSLAVTQGRNPLASVQKIELAGLEADLAQHSVRADRLVITQPKARVERGEDGRWMVERWLKTPAATPPSAPPPKAAVGAGADKPWAVTLGELAVTGGPISVSDLSLAKPAVFEVSAIQLRASQLELGGRKPSTVSLSLRLGAGQTDTGKLSVRGQLTMAPLAVQADIDASQLPVHAFEPYFADRLNIELLRADTSFKGKLRFASADAGPTVRLSGDTTIEEFRANSVVSSLPSGSMTTPTAALATSGGQAAGAPEAAAPSRERRGLRIGEELLSWKALAVRGLDVAVTPGTATTVNLRETALSDFYARVVIRESGRINLQDIVKSAPAAGSATAAAAAPAATPTAITTAAAPAGNRASGAAPAPATPASAPAATGEPAAVIAFGPISLINGKVLFSDRFIKPNYTANLSELTGRLSAFSSVAPGGAPQLADLELRGRVEGTASLEVLGKLNPLAKPLALDIKGKVRDLELSPLTPYSVKYAGHGIERGKLSVDVAYLIEPSGQLTATNTLVLNQLTFGEKVEGAPNSLPVKLAVALLADRNGVIDINLPISGSLNDPQFSLGPIIFKVIVNLIVKAITSPFSLLAGAMGGGGDELSMVAFQPGSAELTEPARQGLDKVAKALTDRPALKMTVVGTSSLEVERDGFKRERLKQLVQAEKRRAGVVAGSTSTAAVSVSAAEYPVLLKEVYRRADMPKPRNLVGMAKDLPAAEMEALLLANIRVTEDHMRELALARGVGVRDYLAGKNLALERLFLGAAKTGADKPAATDKTAAAAADKPDSAAPAAKPAAAAWSPRAELNLATR
jgi:hypothetical protein